MIFKTFIALGFVFGTILGQVVEEFSVRSPNELHSAAIATFIKERDIDPANKVGGSDTPIMRRAREHAVKRFSAKAESSLKVEVVLYNFTLIYFDSLI